MDIRYFGQSARLSRAAAMGSFVFLSGMVPENTEMDAKDQMQDALAQIDRWLEKCGSDKACIPEATVSPTDMGGYAAMNEAWDEWVAAGRVPVRACVQAGPADSHWAVEIKVSAIQAV